MMAFILATDFDSIAYMSKMAFFGKLFSRQWRFGNMIILTFPGVLAVSQLKKQLEFNITSTDVICYFQAPLSLVL